jgi:hypothetical protein
MMEKYSLKKQPLALDVWQTCSCQLHKHSISISDCDILEKSPLMGTEEEKRQS